jgi:hypothetical protein
MNRPRFERPIVCARASEFNGHLYFGAAANSGTKKSLYP